MRTLVLPGLPDKGDVSDWLDAGGTVEKLLVLAEWLGVPPQQLRFGSEVTQRVQQRRARWDSGVGYQDRDIFEAFLKLPVPQRRLIREVILTFAKVHTTEKG